MKFNSIAMIETNGLVTSITALEAMFKIGNIEFLKREVISNGQVTIFISGDSPDLKRVLQAGEIAAKSIGTVLASSLLENPTAEILDVIFDSKKTITKPKKSRKKNEEVAKVDTLFDDVIEDAIVEEATKEESKDEIIVVEEKKESSENMFEEVESVNNYLEKKNSILIEDSEYNIYSNDELVSEDETKKENTVFDESIVEEENNAKNSKIEKKISNETEEAITDINFEIVQKVAPNVEKEIATIVEENQINFVLVRDKKEIEQETDSAEDKNLFENMTHLERLRAEAKLEVDAEAKDESSVLLNIDEEKEDQNSIASEEVLLNSNELPVEEEFSETNSNLEEDSEYSKMNVPQLRKLARSNPDFPIKGREVSKANRKILINHFNKISKLK